MFGDVSVCFIFNDIDVIIFGWFCDWNDGEIIGDF